MEIQLISPSGFPFWPSTYLSQTTLSIIQLELSLEERGCLEGTADPYLGYQILITSQIWN